MRAAWTSVLALLAIGCSSSNGGNDPPPPPPPGSVDPPPADVELGPLPDTATGRRLAWIVRELNKGGISAEQIERNFTAELIAGFPAPDLSRAFAELAKKIAPLNVDHVVGEPEERRVIAAVLSRGADWYSIKVTTSEAPPYLIAGIFYDEDASLAPPPPPDWSHFETEAAAVAPQVSFLAAEVGATECRAISARTAADSKPIGSAFKLYVLSTLVEEVRAGRVAWDEVMTIADAQKSLPSGYLHLRAAGSTLSVAKFAEAMIADSDNTATDHLMHRMGRTTVEAIFDPAGHHDPAANIPLMTTREFFLLKLYASNEARAAYLSGTPESKRAYLENDLAGVDVFSLEEPYDAWIAPRDLDTIEWFASNEDLCRVMLRLRDEMTTPEGAPLREILAKNTVVTFDPATWKYAGFKGGSEPGLLEVAWLMQRADDRWFLVSMTAIDPMRAIAQGSVVRHARSAMALLARER